MRLRQSKIRLTMSFIFLTGIQAVFIPNLTMTGLDVGVLTPGPDMCSLENAKGRDPVQVTNMEQPRPEAGTLKMWDG